MFHVPNCSPLAVATLRSPQAALNARHIRSERLPRIARAVAPWVPVAALALLLASCAVDATTARVSADLDQARALRAM